MIRFGLRDGFVLLSLAGQLMWLGGAWWPLPVTAFAAAAAILIRL